MPTSTARSSGCGRRFATSSDRPLRVLLRADASATIGTGHVMRLLALADGLRARGHAVALLSHDLPAPVAAAARDRAVDVMDLEEPFGSAAAVGVIEGWRADWIVVDGYGFDASYLDAVHRAARVLVVDDGAALKRYPCELVLNQNAYARVEAYGTRAADARLLIGPRYALLRAEFTAAADVALAERRVRERPGRVLLTVGGTDPAGATVPLLRAIRRALPDATLTVVVGAGHGAPDDVRRAAGDDPRVEVRVGVMDMADLLAASDVAVASAGTTAYELARMGVPALLVAVADNQVPVARAMASAGVAVDLGTFGTLEAGRFEAALTALGVDAERRRSMSEAGQRLVDGRGVRRVVAAIEAAALRLRLVVAGDTELLLSWANDPVTRAASFGTATISRDEHVRWLRHRLDDPDTLFLIGELEQPVGQVRFSRETAEEAVVSVSVAPAARGRGLAPALIDAGIRAAFATWPVDRIRAEIRSDNAASLAAFADAGFDDPVSMADRPDAVQAWRRRPTGGDRLGLPA